MYIFRKWFFCLDIWIIVIVLIVLGIAGGMLWGNSDGKQIKSDSYHKEDSNEK